MKRCPKCRRDYHDDTLSFCLADGSELVYGLSDEPRTAILHETAAPGEAVTRAQMHTTGQTAVLPGGSDVASRSNGFDKRLLLAPLALAVIVIGGFFGYRYFRSGGAPSRISSIAVLPFENRSGSADADYLSDGLTDSLIFRFSQLPNLKVSPTSSVMRYKGKADDVAQVARELGVDAVLSGRLMQLGSNLTISVELIDARTTQLVWKEQYDRNMADLLATQREIARTLTEKMQLKLAGDERGIAKKYTSSNEAYQLYMKGRFHWAKRTKDNMLKAIDAFQQAIDIDPNFALAYVGMAEAHNSMGKNPDLPPGETFPKGKAAATRALEIDPTLAEAHSALGDALSLYDRDLPAAERELKRALELDPNIAYIHLVYGSSYLMAAGQMDEAVREMERAVELEPLSLINNAVLTSGYLQAGRYDKALIQGRKTRELDPNFPFTRIWLGLAEVTTGHPDDALSLVADIPPSAPGGIDLTVRGFAHAKAARKTEALRAIDQLKELSKTRYVRPYYLAWIYTALGDKASAIDALERSFDERDGYFPRARMDALLAPLRDEPRFKELMARMPLPK